MADSGYEEDEIPVDRLAHGYIRREDRLVREGTDRYGALASMGGLYSTVRDLARWVAFHLDAFPARSDPDDGPLRRASRREMAQVQRALEAEREASPAHESPPVENGGYGFGLFLVTRDDVGLIVGHGGGYPGYGTMMVWHPSTGIGIVSAGNLRYASLHELTRRSLIDLVRADDLPGRRIRVLPAVEAHRGTVMGLLERWDDAVADAAFAMNVDLDEPRDARRAAIAKAVEQVGGPMRLDEATAGALQLAGPSPLVAARRARLARHRVAGQPGAGAADPGAARDPGAGPVAGAPGRRPAAARQRRDSRLAGGPGRRRGRRPADGPARAPGDRRVAGRRGRRSRARSSRGTGRHRPPGSWERRSWGRSR